MIEIKDKTNCCGCTSCAQTCPVGAIEMVQDSEGFYYPNTDINKCIKCNKCNRVCPIINCRPEEKKMQTGYVAQHLDDTLLKKSTSGGTFGAIASKVIENGGVVYGAAFDEDFYVHHIGTDKIEDLTKLQKSKYVQSKIDKDLFIEIEEKLKSRMLVCFSGTPCQVEGLIHFLGKNYKNLLTVDMACHSVPSSKVLSKYLELYGGRNNITALDFRNKKYGYDYSTLLIETKGGLKINNGTEIDQYMRAFMDNISVRPSCYNCKFKKLYRESDITIWDCFDIWNYNNNNNNKGANKILVHSENGMKFIDSIKSKMSFTQVDVKLLLGSSGEIIKSCEYNCDRDTFFGDIDKLGANDFWNKYYPKRAKNYVNQFARRICVKVGLYNVIKKTIVEVTKKYD